jgi:hypothetical protein
MGKRTLVDLEVDGKTGFKSRNGWVGYPSILKFVRSTVSRSVLYLTSLYGVVTC